MKEDKQFIDALEKKAKGFSATEISEEYSTDDEGNLVLVRRKVNTKYYPPDTAALKSVLDRDDVGSLSDEELIQEKRRLLAEFAKITERKGEYERQTNEQL